ncbi:hypothetical protein [Limnoglobus roseus]|uniref:hypothetical protein n=1 Tax=Limnoglobus roseus TaxID=2598579 RepID=UPI0011EB9109|nr:hypothetical protein [Limnoglobus roseus]
MPTFLADHGTGKPTLNRPQPRIVRKDFPPDDFESLAVLVGPRVHEPLDGIHGDWNQRVSTQTPYPPDAADRKQSEPPVSKA